MRALRKRTLYVVDEIPVFRLPDIARFRFAVYVRILLRHTGRYDIRTDAVVKIGGVVKSLSSRRILVFDIYLLRLRVQIIGKNFTLCL